MTYELEQATSSCNGAKKRYCITYNQETTIMATSIARKQNDQFVTNSATFV